MRESHAGVDSIIITIICSSSSSSSQQQQQQPQQPQPQPQTVQEAIPRCSQKHIQHIVSLFWQQNVHGDITICGQKLVQHSSSLQLVEQHSMHDHALLAAAR
jgi:hypothetical protein